jgi:hypothetical protein
MGPADFFFLIDRPIIATRIVDVEYSQQVNARETIGPVNQAFNRPIAPISRRLG